ncbi:MAG: type II toxin-antitoxin system VapB family antitoxin [Candidatus Dormibacteria bacterium]
MRTTVNIDDHLLAEAKARAAAKHRTLGEVVDDALRVLLIERVELASTRRRVALPTAGGSGLQPGVDLEDKEALAELLGDNAARHAAG